MSICANYLITSYGSSVGDSGLNNKISLCTGLSKIDVIVFMVTLRVSSSLDGKTYVTIPMKLLILLELPNILNYGAHLM